MNGRSSINLQKWKWEWKPKKCKVWEKNCNLFEQECVTIIQIKGVGRHSSQLLFPIYFVWKSQIFCMKITNILHENHNSNLNVTAV